MGVASLSSFRVVLCALVCTPAFPLSFGCARTVEVGLPSCDDVDVFSDETDVTCDDLPALCDLPVSSEPPPDDGTEPIDVVFVEVGGLRQGAFEAIVADLFERQRRAPGSIVGRDPTLFRTHVVEVPEPSWFGDDLPACSTDDGLKTGLTVSFSRARAALAARSAPVDADVVVAVFPEVGQPVRENASGNVIASTTDGDAFDHELGHVLGLGDEYVEFDDCYDGVGDFAEDFGDTGITANANIVTDEAGASFDGLASTAEGGARSARCAFHPEGSCTMNTGGGFCPVCDRAIEAALSRFAPERHADAEPVRCRLRTSDTPRRGVDLDGAVITQRNNGTADALLNVDGAETPLFQSFHIGAAETAGARSAFLLLRCEDGDDKKQVRVDFE